MSLGAPVENFVPRLARSGLCSPGAAISDPPADAAGPRRCVSQPNSVDKLPLLHTMSLWLTSM